jgi:hypothetical protein
MVDMRAINLPADLCLAAEKKFAGRFGDVEELLAFLLREVTLEEAGKLDKAEQRMIEERLKDLGYI